MGINDYSKTPRNDGYTGIRVARRVNGKYIQKYFARGNIKKAMAFDAKLAARQAKEHKKHGCMRKRYVYKTKRFDTPRRTPITGLTFGFQEQKQCNPVKHYPVIFIAITSRRNLQKTWGEACKLLADYHELKRIPRSWKQHCPTRKDFLKLRRHYVKNGVKISLSTLDTVN